jgi:hypothetical protein
VINNRGLDVPLRILRVWTKVIDDKTYHAFDRTTAGNLDDTGTSMVEVE